jgi:thioredoxin reductase (NADPH)
VISAKSVIIATGARYNRLPLDRLSEFEGVGVYYAATQMEAHGLRRRSGRRRRRGQLGRPGRTVPRRHLHPGLHRHPRSVARASSMSRYLIDQIERMPHITVLPHTQVTALNGRDRARERGAGEQRRLNETSTLVVRGLFVFIGAQPATGWLDSQLAQDENGFLLTGTEVPVSPLDAHVGTPLFLETSRPGIFCVGDVRSGSVKRCATAIGEGSMAVRLVFERLQATGTGSAQS